MEREIEVKLPGNHKKGGGGVERGEGRREGGRGGEGGGERDGDRMGHFQREMVRFQQFHSHFQGISLDLLLNPISQILFREKRFFEIISKRKQIPTYIRPKHNKIP